MSDFTSTPTSSATTSAAPPKLNTVLIWAMLVVPFLLAVMNIAVTVPAMVSSLTGTAVARVSPLGLILPLVIWIGLVVCAYFDERYLKGLGIYKPFPWGWAFLSGLVYVIGRSVVVIRRTDEGRAPLWGALIYVVLAIIGGITIFSVFLNAVRG